MSHPMVIPHVVLYNEGDWVVEFRESGMVARIHRFRTLTDAQLFITDNVWYLVMEEAS